MDNTEHTQRCGGYCPGRIKRGMRPLSQQADGCFRGRGGDISRAERAEVSEM